MSVNRSQIVFFFFVGLMVTGCSKAPEEVAEAVDDPVEYPVLTHSDYEAATGCDVDVNSYEPAIRTALAFLVFADEPVADTAEFEPTAHDAQYVRRHSRDMFGPLFASQAAGGSCLHKTLERIGRAVGFPEEGDVAWDAVQSVREPNTENVVPYLLTSRADYIAQTGCLVDEGTYNHYRVAFLDHVLYWDFAYDAADRLSAFLQETGEGMHTEDGYLDVACMTPTIVRIAGNLELLDENGRFAVE